MVGYDAPAPRSEDLLSRWPFARQVYRIVEETPPSWSVRVGIHGKWGDGKTTVLRYVEDLAREHHDIVVKFAPWSAKTRDELWRDFLIAFAEALQGQGIGLGKSVTAKTVSSLLRYETLVRSLSKVNPLTDAAGHGFFYLLRDFLDPVGKTFAKIKHQLGDRHICVLVDDLDRSEPHILPFLFLSLRDIFDLPGFAFVLAFDDDTVARVLEKTRLLEDQGLLFLDKLLDFSFALPTITQEQTRQFLSHLLETHLGSFDPIALDAVSSVIPRNPRKIKRFVRHLTALRPTLDRLDADEVEYRTLYLSLLVKLESQALLERLLAEMEQSNIDLLVSSNDESKGQERRKHLLDLLDRADVRTQHAYLLSVLEKLLNAVLFRLTTSVSTARLWIEIRHVTQKEARKILDSNVQDSPSNVGKWIKSHSVTFGLDDSEVAAGLFHELSKLRRAELHDAAHAVSDSAVNAHIERALSGLRLQTELFCEGVDYLGIGFYRRSKFLQDFVSPMLEWAHFNINEADRYARDREKEAVSKCVAAGIDDPEDFLVWLGPWESERGSYGGKERRELLALWMPRLEEAVALGVIQKFERFSGLEGLLGESGIAERYVLALVEGPLWKRREQLFEVLEKAGSDLVVHENSVRLLDLICTALDGGAWPLNSSTMKDLLGRYQELAPRIWAAAISQGIQFRMQSDMRKQRQQLIAAGVEDERLPLPRGRVTAEHYEELTGRTLSTD